MYPPLLNLIGGRVGILESNGSLSCFRDISHSAVEHIIKYTSTLWV